MINAEDNFSTVSSGLFDKSFFVIVEIIYFENKRPFFDEELNWLN